jgi:hypothetical protein
MLSGCAKNVAVQKQPSKEEKQIRGVIANAVSALAKGDIEGWAKY